MKRQAMRILGVIAALAALGSALPAQTEEAARILAQTKEGVVGLTAIGEGKQEIGRGAGLALGQDVVVTAYHLVGNAQDVTAVNAKGKKLKVEGILAVDKDLDLALLKIKGKLQELLVGSAENVPEGGRIFAVGPNESEEITVSEGTARRSLALSGQINMMEVSLTVSPTYLGAPVFDLSGALVGMVMVLDRGLKFVLPSDRFKTLVPAAKPTAFKDWPKEDYFGTLPGAFLAGRAGALLGDNMIARTSLEKVVQLDPARVEAHDLLAGIYFQTRDYTAAVPAFRKVVELDPERAAAHYGLGQVLMRMSRHAEAVPALEKAVSLGIDAPAARLELAGALEETKDFAKAAEAYEAYLAGKPEKAEGAWLRLAICRSELQQYDAAVAALQESLKIQPEDLKVNVTLAEVYEKAGQLENAESVYDNLAGINPPDAKTYLSRALMMYDGKGRFDKALDVAKKISALNPADMMSLYNVGVLNHKVEKYDDSNAALKTVLDASPDNAQAWYYHGFNFYNLKKYREAIPAFRKYTELQPEDSNGWLLIGVSAMFLKDYEGALNPLQKCVELSPGNAAALFNLGVVYVNLRDSYSAKEVLTKLQGLDQGMAEKLRKIIR